MSSNPRNGRDLRPVVSQTLKSFYLFSTNFGLDYFPLNLMVTCSSSGCFHNKESTPIDVIFKNSTSQGQILNSCMGRIWSRRVPNPLSFKKRLGIRLVKILQTDQTSRGIPSAPVQQVVIALDGFRRHIAPLP